MKFSQKLALFIVLPLFATSLSAVIKEAFTKESKEYFNNNHEALIYSAHALSVETSKGFGAIVEKINQNGAENILNNQDVLKIATEMQQDKIYKKYLQQAENSNPDEAKIAWAQCKLIRAILLKNKMYDETKQSLNLFEMHPETHIDPQIEKMERTQYEFLLNKIASTGKKAIPDNAELIKINQNLDTEKCFPYIAAASVLETYEWMIKCLKSQKFLIRIRK